MRAILAGGGTGGHVIPALAVAQQLQKQFGTAILFIGTSRGIENRLVPAAGFELKLVQVGALKNVSLTTRLRTFSDLPRAILESRRIFREFHPDVVIGVGGYASGPAMLAAIVSRIPTLVFEPNFVPGFANRIVAPFVSAAAVHFEQTGRYFKRCQVTGVPVREKFFAQAGKPDAPTLLIFGGSQGAHAINTVVMKSAGEILARNPNLRIVHQTGEKDFTEIQAAYAKFGDRAQVYRFIEDMPAAFAGASLLICRSGASTVAEVTAAGKPAIFVPFPYAADDHQKRNAEALEKAGAAVMIDESKLSSEILVETVTTLLTNPSRLETMSQAARKMSHPDAAQQIAEMAAKLAKPQ